MTNSFQERERAAEWAFAHEGEMRFLLRCTALRALARHACDRIGADPAAAEDYARDLVSASVNGVKDDVLIARVRADLEAHGIAETDSALRERLTRYLAEASLGSRAASG